VSKTVAVFTGTRAEYGLLKYLISRFEGDEFFDLRLIVGGTHLCSEYGYTLSEIEADGFRIDEKLDFLMLSGTESSVVKSMGLIMIELAEKLERIKPDIIVLLGDRFETFAVASASVPMKIPIAHIHGGEITSGAVDDQFRHATTKLSHIHFTSTEIYRKRIIQMGESPRNVHCVGALGLEGLGLENFVEKKDLESFLDFKLDLPFWLVTFHPETLSDEDVSIGINKLCQFCVDRNMFKFIFTGSNADAGGNRINHIIKDYVSQYPDRLAFVPSFGKKRYLSALHYASGVMGNSSSGIIEAPSFKIPVINIGKRQGGRVVSDLVINCAPRYDEIKKAFDKASSDSFKKFALNCENPYFKSKEPSFDTVRILKEFLLRDDMKKKFYDIDLTI